MGKPESAKHCVVAALDIYESFPILRIVSHGIATDLMGGQGPARPRASPNTQMARPRQKTTSKTPKTADGDEDEADEDEAEAEHHH